MPAAGVVSLGKGEVMMHLALAGLNRRAAANDAGVSESTFLRAMRRWRIKAPRCNAKLTAEKVRSVRALLEKHTQPEVAAMMQVHPLTIGMIARYQTWYWVR
jgi:transposase